MYYETVCIGGMSSKCVRAYMTLTTLRLLCEPFRCCGRMDDTSV